MARVFITGSTEGLGRATARSLLDSGHEVVLHARSPERASALADLSPRSTAIAVGDLRSAAEVCSIAEQVNALGAMDAVIHNAGIYSERSRNPTLQGHAGIPAVNTLAPYMLTVLIARPRHRSGEGSLRDLDWTKRSWAPSRAYAESKLHVVAFAGLPLATRPLRRFPAATGTIFDRSSPRPKRGIQRSRTSYSPRWPN
jgi:NAD(P)-dependent dehydrogenase (short-subunit alcohol dehydrogenase family)